MALNGGAPTVTNYTYNAANQLSSGGATYDNNGNLTSDGTNPYTWDRANRLLSMGGASYKYDGLNNRVQQTVGANVTKYLLDLQPGLAVVLSETTGANVTRYVHSPRGIHAHKDAAGAWEWMMQDGLGSVRGVVDNTVGVLWSGSPAPFGEYFGESGTRQTNYGFTGEYTDPTTQLVHLRARDYNPALGVFTALDPFEGKTRKPMLVNGYNYVDNNPINRIDPSGKCWSTGATDEQKGQCLDAWISWAENINTSNPDVRRLLEQETRYWAFLPYSEFVNQWNSSRSPASTNPGGDILAAGLPAAGLISQLDTPFPGPADVVAIVGAVCLVGLAVIANAGGIALPMRQPYFFSDTGDRADEMDIPIPYNPDNPCPFAPCDDVEGDIIGNVFYSMQKAMSDLRNLYGRRMRIGRNETTYPDNPVCPDIGDHWTIEPHNEYPYSIICCPCCTQYGVEERCYHTG